jgi:hypothetical protein
MQLTLPPFAWLQVMGVLDAMPSSNLKPENEGEVKCLE